MITRRGRQISIAACAILAIAGFVWWLKTTRSIVNDDGQGVYVRSSSAELPGPVAKMGDEVAGDRAKIEFPFTGKIDVITKEQSITWKDPHGASFEFPFKFYYSESGVWIRAEYVAEGNKYEDYPIEGLEKLYASRGQKIVGLPAKPPKMSIQEFFDFAHGSIQFEKGSRIVIDHVVLQIAPAAAEPYLMLKVWGADKAWADSPDNIPRVRILKGMESGEAWLDDAL